MSAAFADEQDRWKNDAMQMVKQEAFYMKRALELDNLRDALKHAANLLSELRTSLLSPKNYYELYMQATDELRYLEAHFTEQQRTSGRSMLELYELVQHAGNILPRLYLLVTVGAVYIRSQQAPAKDILKDLVEMCRGVQHPLRGLFLRNYLSQMCKDKLPDVGTPYHGKGGSVDDAIDFVLCNFTEMNKLWVRIQHQGPVREREKREKERQDLRILVGTNLVRLSQLEGVDVSMYAAKVLTRILDQISNCKDQIAQSYLMECIIQVFPDEYHLHTLESLLQECTQLQPGVDVQGILVSLMHRLGTYVTMAREHGTAGPGGAGGAGGSSGGAPEANGMAEDVDGAARGAFGLLTKYTGEVITSQQAALDTRGVVALQLALATFALRAYPKRRDYVDEIYASCVSFLGTVPRDFDGRTVQLITQLLVAPLEVYCDVRQLLGLNQFPSLLAFLRRDMQKAVATDLVRNVIKHDTVIHERDDVDRLFAFIAPLVEGGRAHGASAAHDAVHGVAAEVVGDDEEEDEEDFEQEQGLVSRLVHYFEHEDTDLLCRMLDVASTHLAKGGPRRTRRTMVPVVFRCLHLTRLIHARVAAAEGGGASPPTVSTKKMFEFIHRTITAFPPEAADVALRLHLQAAQAADEVCLEQIAYEFVTQAFILFEDELSDSKAQASAIAVAVSTLRSMRNLSLENYETLATKATQYSAKLLKKPDQCRAVSRAAHLFWVVRPQTTTLAPAAAEGQGAPSTSEGEGNELLGYTDGKRVKECLQRALKTADACKVGNVHLQLFVEVLNEYLYYLEHGVPEITPKIAGMLMGLIEGQLSLLDTGGDPAFAASVRTHYNNTLRSIEARKSALQAAGNLAAKARYDELALRGGEPTGAAAATSESQPSAFTEPPATTVRTHLPAAADAVHVASAGPARAEALKP
mmetsp:Transcript_7925/g.21684  ORF Transcript_7925/g.21684 Transcript_7925/m.21684 type:complete len:921 (+) Transcript_7925:45-2807(+)